MTAASISKWVEWMFDTEARRDKSKVWKAFNEPPANVLLEEKDRWTPTYCLVCSKGLEEGFGAHWYLWRILIIVHRGKGSAVQHVPCACKRWEALPCRTLHVVCTGWVDLWLHCHCHCAQQLWSPSPRDYFLVSVGMASVQGGLQKDFLNSNLLCFIAHGLREHTGFSAQFRRKENNCL